MNLKVTLDLLTVVRVLWRWIFVVVPLAWALDWYCVFRGIWFPLDIILAIVGILFFLTTVHAEIEFGNDTMVVKSMLRFVRMTIQYQDMTAVGKNEGGIPASLQVKLGGVKTLPMATSGFFVETKKYGTIYCMPKSPEGVDMAIASIQAHGVPLKVEQPENTERTQEIVDTFVDKMLKK